jgi:hypothetical protein
MKAALNIAALVCLILAVIAFATGDKLTATYILGVAIFNRIGGAEA